MDNKEVPVSTLKVGQRIRRFTGEIGTIIYSNDCRVRIRFDTGVLEQFKTAEGKEVSFSKHKEIDVSPSSEVEPIYDEKQ